MEWTIAWGLHPGERPTQLLFDSLLVSLRSALLKLQRTRAGSFLQEMRKRLGSLAHTS